MTFAAWGLWAVLAVASGDPDGGGADAGPGDCSCTGSEEDFLPTDAGPPQGFLTGRVQVMGTREALPAAHLEAVGGDAGCDTDADGRFSLALPAGSATVRVTAQGFEPRLFDEHLADWDTVEVLYRLRRTLQTWETVVRARRDTEAPRVELSRTETHEVAGTQGDPLRVTMLMPGVAGVASGLSWPVVRGTQPAATGFFLDGVRLPQMYHLLAGPSVINPEFIDRVDFFSGAVPSAYGRLLGGVVDAKVSRPSDRVRLVASADLINSGVFLSVPIDALALRITAAGRFSYTPLLGVGIANALFPSTPAAPRPTPVANFYDYQTRVEWAPPSGKWRLLVLGSSDEAGQRQTTPETQTVLLTSVFHRADLAWRRPLGPGTVEAGVTGGVEKLGLLGERDHALFGRFLLERSELSARLKWTATLWEALTVDTGVELDWQTTSLAIDRDPTPVGGGQAASFRAPHARGVLAGAWLEGTWSHAPWTVAAGVRGDLYRLEPDVLWGSVDPRLSLRYQLTAELGLRAAASLAHQPPTVLVNLPISDMSGLRDGLQSGARFEAGVDARLPWLLEAQATAFYDPVFRAIEYSLEDLLTNRQRLSGSEPIAGRAYGVELMLRRASAGRFFGWVSYTLLRAERFKRVYDFDGFGDVTGSKVRWVPFEFDQTHVLNLTFGVVLPKGFKVSAGLHLNSGRPETGVMSSRAMTPGVDPSTFAPTWVPVSLWKDPRLPPFARLDVRGSKTWTFDDWTLELYLDVMNASVSAEVLGYTYLSTPVGGPGTLTRVPFAVPLVLPFLGLKGAY